MKHLFTKICIILIVFEILLAILMGMCETSLILLGLIFVEEILVMLYELTR